jgi:hexosaminidase
MAVSNGLQRVALMALVALIVIPSGAKAASSVTSAEPALIPAPASMQSRAGSFLVGPTTQIRLLDPQARAAAEQFAGFVARTHGLQLKVQEAEGSPKGAIDFRIDPTAVGTDPESYTLDADPQRIVVSARDPRGLFYGAVTLWQLLTKDAKDGLNVAAVHIDDTPRFAWRGLMLDSARHFQTVDEIKQLLDAMALHKLNTFHWHLTDDQGWRIEIKRYPKLTEVGGCRIPAGDGGIGAHGKPKPYCGYYTQEQRRGALRSRTSHRHRAGNQRARACAGGGGGLSGAGRHRQAGPRTQ